MTIVPLKIYFNEQGRAKVEIALARGKKLHDKRETEKARDWSREKARAHARQGLIGAGQPRKRAGRGVSLTPFSPPLASASTK